MARHKPLVTIHAKIEQSKKEILVAHCKDGDNISDIIRDAIDLLITHFQGNEKPPKTEKPLERKPTITKRAEVSKNTRRCEAQCTFNLDGKGECVAIEYPGKDMCKKSPIEWVRFTATKPPLDW